MIERLILVGTTSADVIDVSSSVQPHEIYARKGRDLVVGTALDDIIAGEEGNDDLFGGDGNDIFLIGRSAGEDLIDGGAGYDIIRGDDGDTTIQLRMFTAGHSIEEINGGGGRNTVIGTAGSNTLDFSGTVLVNIDLIDGGKGDDVITGTAFNDRIRGSRGNDTLMGGGGVDTALYAGFISSYEITVNGNQVTVKDLENNFIDHLTDFSFLQFTDTIFDVTGSTGAPPPEAVQDAVSGAEDTPVAIDVLANDSSPNNGVLAVTEVTQSTNGSVTINPDNTLTYVPRADFSGTDSFTYTLSDGSARTATATVTVSVLPSPDPPVVQNDQASTNPRTPVVINVLSNDSDPDGDSLTIAGFTQPANGTVTENANGTLTYTPAGGFSGSDAFTYTVTDQGFTSSATVSLQVTPPPPSLDDLNFRQILTAATENEWVRVNLNQFHDVWTPPEQRAAGGNHKPDSVIGAWSSMAWDSARGDLIFWGGGHANYPGNEIYRWHSSTLEWERASLPSEMVQVSNSRWEAVDGYLNAPVSSHTYDNSEYLSIVDRFVVLGGAAWGTGGAFVQSDGVTKTGPYFWDPSRADGNMVGGTTGSHANPELFPDVVGGEMWENRDNLYLSGLRKNLVNGTSAYADENGKDVLYFGDTSLYKYTVHDINDPSSDTYEKVGTYYEAFSGDGAGAISTDLNIYLRTSKNKLVMWDLNNASPSNRNVNFLPDDPSGTFDFARLADYGMDYDPIRGVFILWKGDAEVWALTPPDQVSATGWALSPLAPGALNEAPDTSTVGVFGKWKYVEEQDIFIGVNDKFNGDVWVYKPDDWQPSNTLPELTLANIPELELQPGDVVPLTDLIDWSDADGDTLNFNFTDLNADPTSGYFLWRGGAQNAGKEIAVSANQLVLGDLLWVMGEADQSDDITVRVSDPFGSAPVATVGLPSGAGSASTSVASLNAEVVYLADLMSATA